MDKIDDATLLRRYAKDRSEEAFRLLAVRYAPLVYSTCHRVLGRQDLAEDAAQAVFLILSRKAAALQGERTLAGWLYMTSHLVSKGLQRKERRRMNRELPLNEELAARDSDQQLLRIHLDTALGCLRDADRKAIILRFFQGLSLSELGTTLGISEDAARMRVERALSRMRETLGRSGFAGDLPLLLPLTVEQPSPTLTNSISNFKPAGISPGIQLIAKGATPLMSITSKLLITAGVGASVLAGGYVFGAAHPGADQSPRQAAAPRAAKPALRPIFYKVVVLEGAAFRSNGFLAGHDKQVASVKMTGPINSYDIHVTPEINSNGDIKTSFELVAASKPMNKVVHEKRVSATFSSKINETTLVSFSSSNPSSPASTKLQVGGLIGRLGQTVVAITPSFESPTPTTTSNEQILYKVRFERDGKVLSEPVIRDLDGKLATFECQSADFTYELGLTPTVLPDKTIRNMVMLTLKSTPGSPTHLFSALTKSQGITTFSFDPKNPSEMHVFEAGKSTLPGELGVTITTTLISDSP